MMLLLDIKKALDYVNLVMLLYIVIDDDDVNSLRFIRKGILVAL